MSSIRNRFVCSWFCGWVIRSQPPCQFCGSCWDSCRRGFLGLGGLSPTHVRAVGDACHLGLFSPFPPLLQRTSFSFYSRRAQGLKMAGVTAARLLRPRLRSHRPFCCMPLTKASHGTSPDSGGLDGGAGKPQAVGRLGSNERAGSAACALLATAIHIRSARKTHSPSSSRPHPRMLPGMESSTSSSDQVQM